MITIVPYCRKMHINYPYVLDAFIHDPTSSPHTIRSFNPVYWEVLDAVNVSVNAKVHEQLRDDMFRCCGRRLGWKTHT
jgi:hypothetical protein